MTASPRSSRGASRKKAIPPVHGASAGGAKLRLQHAPRLEAFGLALPELIELFDRFSGDLFWIKDAEGRFVWVNTPFFLNFALKDRSEILGMTDFDYFDPVLANQYAIDDSKVLGGERIVSRMELVGRFSHLAYWCLTSKLPLYDKRGRIVGTAGVARAVNENALSDARESSPLGPAIQHISKNVASPASNDELARLCNLSSREFQRRFLATYGSTPHNYIRQLRVRMSCSALVFSDKPMSAIASEYGFSDQSHFNREFKRVFGENPRAYRTRCRKL